MCLRFLGFNKQVPTKTSAKYIVIIVTAPHNFHLVPEQPLNPSSHPLNSPHTSLVVISTILHLFKPPTLFVEATLPSLRSRAIPHLAQLPTPTNTPSSPVEKQHVARFPQPTWMKTTNTPHAEPQRQP